MSLNSLNPANKHTQDEMDTCTLFAMYARSRMSPLTSIGPTKDTKGLLVKNDVNKAESVNNFFHSVYISNDDNATTFDNRTNVIMPTPTFTKADVKSPL